MKKLYFSLSAFTLTAAGLVSAAVAKASGYFSTSTPPNPVEVLNTIMNVIINTTVSLAITIFTTYWPYILVIGAIIGLITYFKRLTGASHK